jgi:hypothetical protein
VKERGSLRARAFFDCHCLKVLETMHSPNKNIHRESIETAGELFIDSWQGIPELNTSRKTHE